MTSAEIDARVQAALLGGGSLQANELILADALPLGSVAEGHEPVRRKAGNLLESRLVTALLSLVAWGLVYPSTARWLAAEAVADGLQNVQVIKMSKLAAQGDSSQNTRRDMFRTFFSNPSVPKPMSLRVTLLDRTNRQFTGTTTLVSGFDLIQAIWQHHHEIFFDIFGSPNQLEEFWNSVQPDDPKLALLPAHITCDADWKRKTFPMSIHGDAGPYNKKGSASIISVQCKPVLSNWILPCFMLCGNARADPRGENDTFRHLSKQCGQFLWSCTTGVPCPQTAWGDNWPADSHQHSILNTRLCDGLAKMVWWLKAADAEWMANYLECSHWSSIDNTCP